MAEPGTSLSSNELDHLEDALERLTEEGFEPGPEDSWMTEPLRERLGGYRDVLAQVREALPLEDVGDDVLAGVLAEARQGPVKAAVVAGPGWWERLRRSMLLPGVALAGSAALLLYLVQPSDELSLETAAQDESQPLREAARLAPAEAGPLPAAPSPAAPAAMQAPESAVEEKRNDGDGGGGAASEASGAAVRKDMDASKADKPRGKPMPKAEMPADAPLPGLEDAAPAAADKEDLRDTLEQADRARRSGDCKTAMARYLAAMRMDGHASERAQAAGGYGLCLQHQGEDSDAGKYFEQARKLSPGIDGWLAREGGTDAKKPSKSKMKKAMAEPLK